MVRAKANQRFGTVTWKRRLLENVLSDSAVRLTVGIYEVLQTLSVFLTEKRHLKDLFDKSNFSLVKEFSDYSEPSLFNF